jgi:RimJ/RimL family protein N-acetyltransferase
VAGSVSTYEDAGRREVTYWIGKEYWGKGIATRALAAYLEQVVTMRPLYARAAKDNTASLRVLEKCGFSIIGEGKGFANARGAEIEEFMLSLIAH